MKLPSLYWWVWNRYLTWKYRRFVRKALRRAVNDTCSDNDDLYYQ